MKCAVGGCSGSPTPLASGQSGGPWGIAFDSTNVYWSEGVSIMKASIATGGATPLCNESNNPYPVVVSSATVFWTDSIGNVLSCSVGGGTPNTVATSSANASYGLAEDSANLYWTN